MIVTSSGICNSSGLKPKDWNHRISFKSIHDGTSNTFLAGEMHIPPNGLNVIPFNGPIFSGQELDSHTRIGGPGVPILTAADEALGLLGFGSAHPGTTNFVLSDGSVTAIDNFLDPIILGEMCNRNDGRIVGAEK